MGTRMLWVEIYELGGEGERSAGGVSTAKGARRGGARMVPRDWWPVTMCQPSAKWRYGGRGEGQCFWQRPGGGKEGAGILGRDDALDAPQLRLPCPPLQGSAVTGRTTSRWRRVKPSTASIASRCGGCPPSPGTWTPRTPVRTPTRAPAQIRPPKHPTRDPENKSVSLLRGLLDAPRRGCAAGGRGGAGRRPEPRRLGWEPQGSPKASGRERSSNTPPRLWGQGSRSLSQRQRGRQGGQRWAPDSLPAGVLRP